MNPLLTLTMKAFKTVGKQRQTKTTTRFHRFAGVSALCLMTMLWQSLSLTTFASTNKIDLAAQVGRASVLYRPLTWVGDLPPSEVENQTLWLEVNQMRKQGVRPSLPALERFIANYPNSPWTPSLRANLGRYYREHGRYSKALEHWQAAWQATSTAKDGSAKNVADFTFAHWTKLLASLGRKETLKELFRETQGRTFDAGPLQQIINSTKEGYHMMLTQPEICFRCGTYALQQVGKKLNGAAFDATEMAHLSSPLTGFNMKKLLEVAQNAGLEVVAAEWSGEKPLVVPSVVHWKENHYAAIVEQKNGLYNVVDPTFGRALWLRAGDIQAEASGYFIVPKDHLTKSWRELTAEETGQIYGRGFATGIVDVNDGCANGSGGTASGLGAPGSESGVASSSGSVGDGAVRTCRSCSSGGRGGGGGVGSGGNGGSGGSGGSGESQCSCEGMPVWEVSESYINVWLYDEPLGYQPGLGNRISFKLAYKQREPREPSPSFFSLGKMWNSSWLSFIPFEEGQAVGLEGKLGGVRNYAWPSGENGVVELPGNFFNGSALGRFVRDTNTIGFVVQHPNGAKDYYDYIPSALWEAKQVAFLTKQVDPFGNTNRFIYQEADDIVKLLYVIDADGRTNTLNNSDSSFPAQITGVQDPFGRTASIDYDGNGMLTSVTDVVGLTSSFDYNGWGWVTDLITPYGTTTFSYTTNADTTLPAYGGYKEFGGETNNPCVAIRTVKVADPVGGVNLYMLRQDCVRIYTNGWDYYTNTSNFIPFSPGVGANYTGPEGSPNTFGTYSMNWRNTFHWGPKQAVGLPSDLNMFLPNHYKKAWRRNWLHAEPQLVSQVLNMVKAPNADNGEATGYAGQETWFDYEGKDRAEHPTLWTGSSALPALVTRLGGDGSGRFTWYRRDEWGRPTNIVESFNVDNSSAVLMRTNILVYSTNGIDLLKHIGPDGNVENGYAYNSNHQVIRHTNAVGDVTFYTYDAQRRLTSIKTPAGLTTTYIYFATGEYTNWVQTQIDLEIGRTNSYTYTNNLVRTHTDERGLRVTNTWDALQRLRRVDYPDGKFVTNSYNKLDLVRVVDRMGFTNSYGYDAVRRMVAAINPLGRSTLYDYCSCGALNSIRDAAGNYTYFFYDNLGRMTNAVYSDGYAVTNEFDSLNQLTRVSDSAGSVTTYLYNNQGLRTRVNRGFGQAQKLIYDIHDRVTNSVDANGVSLNMTYDDLGRLLTRSYPDGGMERFGYSARGLLAYTNQLGKTTRYAYDQAHRKIAETNANLQVTQFRYDSSGNLTNLIDGKNQNTFWAYDQYGRVTNKVDHASNVLFVYKYDPNGRLTNRWSAAKGTTVYRYDPVGNLTNVDYAVSADLTLQYDALNRLTNLVDAVGTTKYAYDTAGQLLGEDGPWNDDTVSYNYTNRLRSRLSVAQPNASPWELAYGYDADKRLTDVISPAGGFTYDYDSTRKLQVQLLTFPNSAYVVNAYDSVARLTETSLKSSVNSVINSHQYTYDRGNQRTQQVFTAGNYVDYAYDNAGQLKTVRGKVYGGATNRLHEQLGYAYDAAGNLNYRTNNALIQMFNVNSLNQLSNVTRSGTLTVAGTTSSQASDVTVNSQAATLYGDYTFAKAGFSLSDGNNTFTAVGEDYLGREDTHSITAYLPATASYSYDLNGNLLSDGKRGFEYDDENQLIKVTVTNTWKSEFSYDGKMRRRIRKEYGWSGSTWVLTNEVRYLYDGNLVIQERHFSPQIPLMPVQTISYTRGTDLSRSFEGAGGIGGLRARTDHSILNSPLSTSAHAYYHCDGNGNVTCLINSNQWIAAKYLYDPFGNILSASGPLAEANLYRFSSKEIHPNSGLVYYLYRYYEPNLQRWLNRDPIEELGGLNLYGFVANDPITGFDRFGMERCIVYAGNLICIPDNPDPKNPFKPNPQYPKGFSLSQRDLQKDGSCDCPTMIGNALGGEHSYLQHVDSSGNKWGYGWGGGPKGVPEGHFSPNSSKPCKKGSGALKYGSGEGKSGSSATDAEIQDCIKNNPPIKPYKATGYNCKSWAQEAAKNCGLDCN